MIYLPDFKKLSFELDREKGRYIVRICPPGFTKVPAELIVEDRQTDTIRNDVELILRGPHSHTEGKKRRISFFTGLRSTQYADVYDGDILTFGRDSKRVKNYLLLRFTPDAERLTLLYFPGWKPFPDKRISAISEIIGRGFI